MSDELTFQMGNVVVAKSKDSKQVWLVKPKRTKPINVSDDLEKFAKGFINAILKSFPEAIKPDEITTITNDFVDFLAFVPETKKEEISLEIEEEQTVPKPAMKPVTVPLTAFKEEKEEKKTEKESAVDLTMVVARFQELQREGKPLNEIYSILENETGMAKEAIVKILPAPKESINTEKLKPKKIEKPSVATQLPIAVSEEVSAGKFDISKVPGYQYLRPQHVEWLKTLAEKIYNCSVEALVNKYIQEAKKFKIKSDTVWITLLFNDARNYNLIQLVKERVKHLIFAVKKNNSTAYVPCLVDKNIERNLNITLDNDRCYKLPELNIIGRLIAQSIPPYKDIESYPKNYVKITKIEPVSDLPSIPYAYKLMKPLTLKDAIEQAKASSNNEIEDSIYGVITQYNEWSNGNGAFLVIHDGDVDIPLYTNKILLPYDNPFGIDEKSIVSIVDKVVLVYGYIQYNPPKGNFPEGIIIRPMYLKVVS